MKNYGRIKSTIEKTLSLISIMSSTKRIDAVWYLYDNIVTTIIEDEFITKNISIRLNNKSDFMAFGVLNRNDERIVKFQILRHTDDEMLKKIFLSDAESVTKLYKVTLKEFDTNLMNHHKTWDTKYKNVHHLELSYLKDKPNTIRHIKTREHNNMIEYVSSKIRSQGIIPSSNKDIDLMYKCKTQVIMEFKTITDQNEYKQISKAIQQLEYYEFKHFLNTECEKIIVVNDIVSHQDLISYCEYKDIKIYYYNSDTNILIDLNTYDEVEFGIYTKEDAI